jgi:dynactin complex subunit
VQDKHYFDCKPNHGLFVRQSQVCAAPSVCESPTDTC